ncbi:MAG: hydrogenase maturation protease [Calditrichaeota bacterium]|nr:MAG: hydrogenase expression/formation protein [Calditrichota bacterium]MBL1206882.1 hydrogenase maturation protease [Calditrichota bacterium]NOG46709.1 HyaD/HybD family hydrogenase maturation endopeptidase [Calditrichota bacterium]
MRSTRFSKVLISMNKTQSQTAIIGLGNILLRDEGIGIHVINNMNRKYTFSPHVNLIDGGTSSYDLLPYFEENKKIIIVDAIDFEKEPGYINSFENDEILMGLNKKLSLHHLGLTDLLTDLKIHGLLPQEIFLVGMQPAKIEMGLDLSKTALTKVNILIDTVIDKLKQWSIKPISLGKNKVHADGRTYL